MKPQTNSSSNIELRSKKVRNIIGHVPPYLSKVGFAVIFGIFALFVAVSYFYQYEYVIKTTATVVPISDSTVTIKVYIPVNQIERVCTEQLIVVFFDNIANMNGYSLQLKTKKEISPVIDVSDSGGYCLMEFSGSNPVHCNSGVLAIREPITLKTEIYTGKERLWKKVFKW